MTLEMNNQGVNGEEAEFAAPLPDRLAATTTLSEYKPFPPDVTEAPAKRSVAATPLKLECVSAFVKRKIPPREMVLSPILPSQCLAMLFAKRGVGKTFVGLNIAYAIATGGEFLNWKAPKARKVVYVDGEMPAVDLQTRLARIIAAHGHDPAPEFFKLLAMSDQDIGIGLNLYERADQARLDTLLEGAEFVVLDNISTLVSGGSENEAEAWGTMQPWLIELRRRGISVLLVHHAGKNGGQRGTSKREDALDTVIQLDPPHDYKQSEGARFVVRYTKHRGFFGNEAMPFEARLCKDAEQRDVWLTTPVSEESDLERTTVEQARAAGKTYREIEAETGISKSKAQELMSKRD